MTSNIQIDSQALRFITNKQAWFYRITPFNSTGKELSLYIDSEKVEAGLEEELELLTGRKIRFEKVESNVIQELLEKNYQKDLLDTRQQNAYFEGDSDSFLNHLINEARQLNSSDIHIEIFEKKCRVRIRIDGVLVERYLLDKKKYPSLINKIKISANLDIAEKRLPQDGRIFFEKESVQFDIRVSVLPTLHGEKIVLRLLTNDTTNIEIMSLGFSSPDLNNYLEGIKRPNGIMLISGPTGSGKTTTLYATLKLLNKETRNILTIEDPIEYTLEGINQVQLKESIGLTFPTALKTFLRQDPDIIMLGEIRDKETANMAIRAALTGHLVLSTIHTNSAWGIISRLIDMGVAPYLLANTLNTAVAQRLVRLLCSSCKMMTTFDELLYPKKFRPNKKMDSHFLARGCDKCYNTGYKGRKAIYEVIPIDEEFADAIRNSRYDVAEKIKQCGINSLSENAFELFANGDTTIDEIYPLLMN